MKRFFTNTAVKFLAFCLAALFSVGAVMLAFCAVNFADQGCVPGQRYEDSAAYRSILSGYIISAANLYRMQGEDLETSGLSFVDQQERQARREELEQDLAGKVSNFRFEIRTADGKARLYSNLLEGESFESLNIAPQYATVQDETISLLFSNGFSDYFRMGSDHLFRSDVYYDDYDSYYSVIYGSEYSAMDSAVSYAVRENGSSVYESLDSSSADAYVLCWGVRPDYPVDDALLRMNNWYFSMQNSMPGYICAAVLCALLALTMLVFVCWGAGRRRHVDGVVLRVFDRIPYEVVLAVLCIAGVLGLPVCGRGLLCRRDIGPDFCSRGISQLSVCACGGVYRDNCCAPESACFLAPYSVRPSGGPVLPLHAPVFGHGQPCGSDLGNLCWPMWLMSLYRWCCFCRPIRRASFSCWPSSISLSCCGGAAGP